MAEPQVPPSLSPQTAPGEEAVCEQPVARFFGVPFHKGLAREMTSIQLCPSRVHLASLRDGAELEICNRITFQRLELGERARASRMVFRPSGLNEGSIELAIAGPLDQREILRWDLAQDRALPALAFPGATALTYSGDGRFVAAGGEGGQVKAWHLGPEGPRPVLEASTGARVESLAFHPEHPTLYGTLATGDLVALELAPGSAAPVAEALRAQAPGARFQRVAVGPRGYGLYLAARDESVFVVDTATGEVGAFDPGVGPLLDLQVLPRSGNLCAVGRHAVYLARAVTPACTGHNALVCTFEEPVYAACELDREAVLVFHGHRKSG